MNRLIFIIVGVLLACSRSSPVLAVSDYYQGWDRGSLGDWRPGTAVSAVAVSDVGGSPGGFIRCHSDNTHGPFEISAVGSGPEVSGDYVAADIRRISFEAMLITGRFEGLSFRVCHRDAPDNGWYFPLYYRLKPAVWNSFVIEFDPTWSDAHATVNGWVQEPGSPSFMQTMSHVCNPEVRIAGEGEVAAGIDNFHLYASDAHGRTRLEPDPCLSFYPGGVEAKVATLYIGDFDRGFAVEDIDAKTLLVNGNIVPTSVSVRSTYPGFSGEVMRLEFPLGPFLEGYGTLYDTTLKTLRVSGVFSNCTPAAVGDGLVHCPPLAALGYVTLIGRTSGDVDLDGKLSVADITYLGAYLFLGGMPPADARTADVDGDQHVTVADLVTLLTLVFL